MRNAARVYAVMAAMAVAPWYLALLPAAWRLNGHLIGTPLLWALLALLLPRASATPGILGYRKFWPFVWVPGLMALSLPFLGVGYIGNSVVFSYGLTRPQAVQMLMLPLFLVLIVLFAWGVERPLRRLLLQHAFVDQGVAPPIAMVLVALLGVSRSLPFYWLNFLDARYFAFAMLNLFTLELTLNRFYWVSGNLAACGMYHAAVLVFQAFLLSDVLSPYLPAFHWISSDISFYWLMSGFLLLPLIVLSFVPRPPAMLQSRR